MAPPKKHTRCYSLRLEPARHAAWKAAASSRGMSFSEYVTARVEGGGAVTITGDFHAAPAAAAPALAIGPLVTPPAVAEREAALAELAGLQAFADAPVVEVAARPPPPKKRSR